MKRKFLSLFIAGLLLFSCLTPSYSHAKDLSNKDIRTQLRRLFLEVYSKPYVKVSDVKAYDVAGGSATATTWHTRDINTEDSDDSNICSIASNQITLDTGTYICSISCPALDVNSHNAILYNITDSTITLQGTAEHADAAYVGSNRSFIVGKFTISTQKTFEVRHYTTSARVTNGLGALAGVSGYDSVYTIAEFWRQPL